MPARPRALQRELVEGAFCHMNKDQIEVVTLMGIALLCVQQAEGVLSSAVVSVLERRATNFAHQSEAQQKKTLGDFLKKLKAQTKLEFGVKERLFKFLEMRNKFIHNPSEIPEWNLQTKEGRLAIKIFLAELSFSALAITSLFMTLFQVSAKDEFGVDLFEDQDKEKRAIAAILENQFGAKARRILAGRYHKPTPAASTRRAD